MEITLKSTEIENFSIIHEVAKLIRKNPIYQLNGKWDRMMVAEIQRYFPNTYSDSITRAARQIRFWRRKIKNDEN